MPELWDIYDENRNITGKTIARGELMAEDEYHLVVQVWIKNDENKWLILKRAATKSQALKWEPTGGSVLAGEGSKEGALREVKEELGISLDPESGDLFRSFQREQFTWENPGFLDVWVFKDNTPVEDVVLQQEETIDAKWASSEEIVQLIENGEFVPFGKDEYYRELL